MDFSSVLTDHEKSIGCVAKDYFSSKNKRTFYNTNQTTGAELVKAKRDAGNQQDLILEYFQSVPNAILTPSHIHRVLFHNQATPLTSIRRAISNLTETGKLRKTKLTRPGLYGKNEHCWQYNGKPGQMSLF